MLFLHGGTGFLECFYAQIPTFSKQYKAIALDTRGHGKSTDNDEPFDYGVMAEDVYEFLNVLGIEKVNLLGWSDGANFGIDLAINHPEKLNKMILVGANFHYSGLNEKFKKKYRKCHRKAWPDWGADEFADGQHQFVDALVHFARALGVFASHLPEALLSARLVLVHALRDGSELDRHLVEPASGLSCKLGNRLFRAKVDPRLEW